MYDVFTLLMGLKKCAAWGFGDDRTLVQANCTCTLMILGYLYPKNVPGLLGVLEGKN